MLRDKFSLEGKLAVVAGGSGAIGRCAAQVFQEMGARLLVTGRDPGRLEETVRALPAGADVTVVAGDARDESHLAEVVEAARARGGVDVYVNCVGAQRRKPLLEATAEDLEYLWSINVGSVFALTQRLLPQMVEKGYGKVIHLCSIASFIGIKDKTLYAITKGALLQYTRSSAVELAGNGVRVNAIAPGYVDTPMTHDYIHSDREQEYLSAIPLGQFAQVGDLEATLAYLASPASDHMTGQLLVLDGGETVD